MPPRKSNMSTDAADDSTKAGAREDALSIEDLNLPKSIVQRLGKGVLPPNTQIQKDALLAMSKSATVFVNYLTSCAADHAARSNKKTVMPKDVFDAMHDLEFDFMLKRVQDEVERFTSIQADKRNTYRKKVREDKKAAQGSGPKEATSGDADASMNGRMGEPDDDTPPTKRARMESGGEEEDGGDDTVEVEEGDGDEEVEDDEVEEEDEGEEGGDGLTEDPLEEREEQGEDDDMEDGDESD